MGNRLLLALAVVCWLAMAVTMMDIARDLRVSVVTVSKVLRNQGRISAATRKRVLRRAKELHYQMNWVARSLVTRRTYTIGLLLPDFTHPFFAEIARAVAQTVRPHGYHVIISYSEEDPKLELSEADSLLARQVDGLIIASAQAVHCLDLARLKLDKARRGVGNDFEDQALNLWFTFPVVGIGFEHNALVGRPIHEAEGPGADGMTLVDELGTDKMRGRDTETCEQRRIRFAEMQAQGHRVDDFDSGDHIEHG